MLHRLLNEQSDPPSADTPSLTTFFSTSPEVSPREFGKTGTNQEDRRGLPCLDTSRGVIPSVSRHPPSAVSPSLEIAPWANDGSMLSTGGGVSESFFDDRQGKIQISPNFRPDTGGTGASDSSERQFYSDERRPSMASATTVSSQNSNSNSRASMGRGPRRMKIAGFFGDDSIGRDSSRNSDASILTTGQREHSSSSVSQKDRHNSAHTFNGDGRPTSPANSRPRTPLPSSDVTPWLFQDFKVSSCVCVCCYCCPTQSMQVCIQIYGATLNFSNNS